MDRTTDAGAATLEQVAERAGVSRSTVSRVVNGGARVSPDALAAVEKAIAELDYVPNRAARSLASRQTHAVALVVPEDTTRFFGDPYFASIVAGINDRISPSPYMLGLFIASGDPDDKATSFVSSGSVDGALIVSHHTSDEYVRRIARSTPVVYGGRPIGVTPDDYWVDVDNVAGGRLATRHLLDRGRRRAAIITGPPNMLAGVDRLRGFREVLEEAGLEPVGVEDGEFSAAGAAKAMERILASGARPDAVFIASDLMARGALSVLGRAGIRVPDDIAIVGFDDSPVASNVVPPLTTVRQPSRDQGAAMADVLLRRLGGEDPPRENLLPLELVVRESA
ncbi:LacI family DNA-binding transcriptional regulator [Microbacterium karelineae]|uniref:LacI family DNA-binding transcriptional regulator n=1 Tax=Microbacterium karelineae TaxID=2654283 RepID=UPI0012EA3D54|nr:LacI family DNA-binding transcriptional regulator [Microbacterium karelineae]